MMSRPSLFATLLAALAALQLASAFVLAPRSQQRSVFVHHMSEKSDDVLDAAIAAMFGGDDGEPIPPEATQARIQNLVEEHSILLFMKGNKAFPQCGFSDTATKILERYGKDYHAVDVLADNAIREGIKIYSQWPTIPQLYISGEFIGGSDIMLEMFESGELEKLVEEAASS